MNDVEAFARLVDTLRPWLDEVVIVGGWAHRLYRLHPAARLASYKPLTTRDADVAFGARQQPTGNIRDALLASDFHEDLRGEDHPPVSRYVLGAAEDGFYAEFLTPLIGPARSRHGQPNDTVRAAGVIAQRLRYLDVLLTSPWTVRLGVDSGYPLPSNAMVQIPNPAAFVGQKLIIHNSRSPAKRPQDVLYIHDTLDLFRLELDMMRAAWLDTARRISPSARLALNQTRRSVFGEVTDVIRNACRIPADRTLRPEQLHTFCRQALGHIFDTP